MKAHLLERKTIINKPIEEVFDFFSRAENLEKITPPFVGFQYITPLPILMRVGALIDYRIKLYGVPMNWRTEITEWQPNVKFADNQVKGPYKLWYHEHFFEEKDGQTIMIDRVQYQSPGWILEPIVNALFVKGQVEKIFDHRNEVILKIFGV